MSYRQLLGDSFDETMSPYQHPAIPTHIAPVWQLWIPPCAWLHFNLFSVLGSGAWLRTRSTEWPTLRRQHDERSDDDDNAAGPQPHVCQARADGLLRSSQSRNKPLMKVPANQTLFGTSLWRQAVVRPSYVPHLTTRDQAPSMAVQIAQDPPSLVFPGEAPHDGCAPREASCF